MIVMGVDIDPEAFTIGQYVPGITFNRHEPPLQTPLDIRGWDRSRPDKHWFCLLLMALMEMDDKVNLRPGWRSELYPLLGQHYGKKYGNQELAISVTKKSTGISRGWLVPETWWDS